ncbi:MAG: carboxypeptidase regulatory-like domain-containing protein [Deltaproteobacteria bacterium]|nr:carboxypeptidase regulatory-like domain-containing protein [Deltaproteobacteria bacterium]
MKPVPFKSSRVVLFLSVLFLSMASWGTVQAYSYCWSSGTGNGNTWLSGTITAGGVGIKDASVCLNPETWFSGYYYAYECACTDSQGNYSFKKETDPASSCYYSYYDYWSGKTNRYCSWKNASCSKYCIENDNNGWYVGQTFATERYKVTATPPWSSSMADRYGSCTTTGVTINFDGTTVADCQLPSKNIIIRLRVVDDDGRAVTYGLQGYVSGPSYSYKEIDGEFKDYYVTPGQYWVGAYPTDYRYSRYSCISNKTVEVKEGDLVKEVTLKAKRNSAILAGTVTGSDGAPLSGVSVSAGNYDYSGADSCYASGWAQTDHRGNFSFSLPSGSYTLWVYPPYNNNSNAVTYSSASKAVTLTVNQTTTENIVLAKKDSQICGTVRAGNGNGLPKAWVSAWTYGNGVNDWANRETDASGNYCLNTLKGVTYSVQAYYWDGSGNDQSISNCSREALVSVTSPATGIDHTFDVWDSSATFVMLDENNQPITSGLGGGGDIRPKNKTNNQYWCGSWFSSSNGTVTKKLSSKTDYCANIYTWGIPSYDPEKTEHCFKTGEPGENTRVPIQMVPSNATISGEYVDSDGNSMFPSVNYLSVYGTKGNIWRTFTAGPSGYSGKVSAGKWAIGFWLDWNSGWVSQPPGSKTALQIGSAETKTYDLIFYKVGYIKVTVKNDLDEPMKWVWVDANPYSAGDEGGNEEKRCYWNNGCYTNSNGECTAYVGAATKGTTYFLRAFRPWSEMNNEKLTLPEEVVVKVFPGETVEAKTLIFRVMDSEVKVKAAAGKEAVTNTQTFQALTSPILNSESLSNDICKNAMISCYSDLGGYAEATTNESCETSVPCTSGDKWYCVALNQVGGNAYISEYGEITCVPPADSGEKTKEVFFKLNAAATIPDAVNQTWDCGTDNALTLSDKFSVAFPASSLGNKGANCSCTVQPTTMLPYQAAKRPSSFYGYDVTCKDASGAPITQFNADITLCMPVNDEQLNLLSLTTGDVRMAYRDRSTDSYINLTSVTLDKENRLACGKTNHLTEFVLIGNGTRAGVDGDNENSIEESYRTEEPATGDGGGGCGCYVGNEKYPFLDDRLIWLVALILFGGRRRLKAFLQRF